MNFLAHAIFADGPDDVVFASAMGDYIDTSKSDLPIGIASGLLFHQGLDTFYDTHPQLSASRSYLYKKIKGYENFSIDICGDYAIAEAWPQLFEGNFEDYVAEVEDIIRPRLDYLTTKGQHIANGLLQDHWLASYTHKEGLERALNRMADRARRGQLIRDNIPVIFDMLPTLQHEVLSILPDIRAHSIHHLAELGYEPELRVRWREGNSFQENINSNGERQ